MEENTKYDNLTPVTLKIGFSDGSEETFRSFIFIGSNQTGNENRVEAIGTVKTHCGKSLAVNLAERAILLSSELLIRIINSSSNPDSTRIKVLSDVINLLCGEHKPLNPGEQETTYESDISGTTTKTTRVGKLKPNDPRIFDDVSVDIDNMRN